MMIRPPERSEQERIDRGINEGERIDTARLITYSQGAVDERWALVAYINQDKGKIARFILKYLLKSWFVDRARKTNDYGMKWNIPYDENSPVSDGK